MSNNKEKIKICHIVNIITGKSDGVYTHLKMLLKYVDVTKYEQYLVFQGNEAIENEVRALGVEVYVIPSLKKKFSLKSFTQFYSFVKTREIDIIQTHFLKPYTIGGISNIFLRKKMIYNYNGLFIDNKYNSKLEKVFYNVVHYIIYLFNAVDLAIVPSYESKKLLYDETKLFPDIKVYYNGYDHIIENKTNNTIVDYFEKLKKSYLLIGIIARLDIQKRIDVALEIAKIIIRTNKKVFFLFLGDGPLESEMILLTHSLGLDHNVKFMGFVPNAKLYIKYFDLLLFTSDWEGLPLTLWEAMAAGVPVISTDVGGLKEILLKENCGLIFQKGNVEKGAENIINLLNDEDKRLRMGKTGMKVVKEKYNAENFGKFWNNLYMEILK